MKKFLVPIFVVCLLVSLGTGALANFSDAPKSDHWVYNSFLTLTNSGLIQGYPDGSFRGYENATRYEMVEMTARVLKVMEEKLGVTLKEKKYLTEQEVKNLIADSLKELGKIDGIYAALKTLESEFKDDLAAFNTKVTTLENQIGSLQSEIESLKKSNEAQNQEIAALNKTLDEQSQELAAMKKALDAQNQEIEALKKAVQNPEKDPAIEKAAKDAKTAKMLGITGASAGLLGLLLSLF